MVSQDAIFPPTLKCRKLASPVTDFHMITACTPMRKQVAKPTTSATTVAKIPSYAASERCSTKESSIATTGTRLSAVNPANTTARMPTWAARNRNQVQLRRKAHTNEPSNLTQTASTGRLPSSRLSSLRPIQRTSSKFKKLTELRASLSVM